MFLKQKRHYLLVFLQKLTRNTVGIIGVIGVAFLLCIYFFNPWILPYPDLIPNDGLLLHPPAWTKDGDVRFILGTDLDGHDIFSHLLKEICPVLKMATLVTFFVITICILLTLLSLASSLLFNTIKTISNTFFVIPSILISILLCLLLGNSDKTILFALTIALIPHALNSFTQATQLEIKKDYITMARLDGISKNQTIFYYLIPNMLTTYIAEAEIIFSLAILEFISLNFLSIGSTPGSTHWGEMMQNYIHILAINPWAFTIAGIIIILIIAIVHLFCTSLINVIRK